MSNLSDVINVLPPMKSGDELVSALEVLPEYDMSISPADASVRLMALSDLTGYMCHHLCHWKSTANCIFPCSGRYRKRARSLQYNSDMKTIKRYSRNHIVGFWVGRILTQSSVRQVSEKVQLSAEPFH